MVWQLAALLLVRRCGDPCWLPQPWMLRHYHAALRELAAGPYLLLRLSEVDGLDFLVRHAGSGRCSTADLPELHTQ